MDEQSQIPLERRRRRRENTQQTKENQKMKNNRNFWLSSFVFVPFAETSHNWFSYNRLYKIIFIHFSHNI